MNKRSSLMRKKGRLGWLFISPFLLGFFFVYLWVFIDSIRFSFSKIHLIDNGFKLENLLFENYRQVLFVDASFNRTLITAIGTMITNIPTILIFSLFVATLLNSKLKGRATYRAIFFLPVILSTGIIMKADMGNAIMSSVWNSGLDVADMQSTGLINALDIKKYLLNMQFSPELSGYVISAVDNIYNVVNNSGVQILIFLAGLQSISPSIYESAQIEGATGWESFWKITFPMISPLIFLNTIYTVIDSFTNVQNPIIDMINTLAFKQSNYGVASAMAWLYCIVTAVIIMILALVFSKMVFYNSRK